MPYSSDLCRTVFRSPHKSAQGLLARDLIGWVRTQFLGTAAGLGLLEALRGPRDEADIADELAITDLAMLRALLDLGAALGELRHSGDLWELRGVRAKALADPALDGWAGLAEEATVYDGDVYRALARRLRGEPPGDYLADCSVVIARASRIAEPLLATFVIDLVRRIKPLNVLDVGCGTGTYLRYAAKASKTLTAVGVDLESDVIELARRNLAAWGLADRIIVHHADVRRLPPDLDRSWDLVLLFNNIYYFHGDDRAQILIRLRELVPKGAVAVATAVADDRNIMASHLDLVLRSTAGNFPLPTAAEIREGLRAAGFTNIEQRKLAPGQPVRAFVAC